MIGLEHEYTMDFTVWTRDILQSYCLEYYSSPLQCHFRLGHPSLQKLHRVVPSLSRPNYILEYEACQLGKHHCNSFPRSLSSRQSSLFNLVHSDIWGPTRIKSISGFHYLVIFVDDFSRLTWLYLMK